MKNLVLAFLFCIICSACSQDKQDLGAANATESVSVSDQEKSLNPQKVSTVINGQPFTFYEIKTPIMDVPIEEIKTRANQNDPAAMGELSRRILHGEGIDRDVNTGFKLLKKAAEAGDAFSQDELGGFYELGLNGYPKDIEKALEWRLKAAQQGYILAQYNVANYYNAFGKDNDNYQKAIEWYSKAIQQGFPDAEAQLGFLYIQGKGVAQDTEKGKKLLQNAVAHQSGLGCYYLGQYYQTSEFGNKNINEALKWYKKGASFEDPESIAQLGYHYSEGIGVTKDTKQAVTLYKKASKLGNSMAQCNLSTMYYSGEGINKNYKESFKWAEKAATQGEPSAHAQLATLYLNGEGVYQDFRKGFEHSLFAAEHGNPLGILYIGQFYEYGEIVAKSLITAYAHYLLSKQVSNDYDDLVEECIQSVKSHLSASQIQAAEREIPKLREKYGLQ